MSIKRVILIVLDSVGIGAAEDADKFGDVGSHTLGHIIEHRPNIKLPNMKKLGLYNIAGLSYLVDKGIIEKEENPIGNFGMLKEKSNGKESVVGHWEIAGVISEKALPTYPNGFPDELVNEFKEKAGVDVIGNKVASGTQIIEELGDEHVRTGAVILYTSADSVFQIAAHTDVVPLERLYEICKIAREMLVGDHAVARVIARPFTTIDGKYVRTSDRHDYAIEPPKDTIIDKVSKSGRKALGVGKIKDLFSGKGLTDYVFTKDNMDGVDKTLEYMKKEKEGLIFTNLVEFDMLWGHRRDVEAYANGLEDFDKRLTEIMNEMTEEDMLIITADHGCDPTYKGTDHTREHIPVLIYGKELESGVDLGLRNAFVDIASTISEVFNLSEFEGGSSFYGSIKRR